MNRDLIDRNTLLKIIRGDECFYCLFKGDDACDRCGVKSAIDIIKEMSPADTVRTGTVARTNDRFYPGNGYVRLLRCNVCNYESPEFSDIKYCSRCGARWVNDVQST